MSEGRDITFEILSEGRDITFEILSEGKDITFEILSHPYTPGISHDGKFLIYHRALHAFS